MEREMIRVAIDARRLQDRPLFGVGRGLANLIPHLASQVNVVLLYDRRRPPPEVPHCEAVPLAGLGNLPETAWLQVSVPRWLRHHDVVFHGPYNAVPVASSRTPSVVTIHDLSWEHHPEDFPSRSRQVVTAAQARWSVRRARIVITVSEFVRRSILDIYGVDASRVVVARNCIDPIFSPVQASRATAALRRFGVTGSYVVALGGARRRGLAVAVEAWQRATAGQRQRPSLLVVGAERPRCLDGVVHVGRLDDDTWATILAGATAFCYPTRYEGFGMPALEAAASGVPVVCGRIGPLPEILGDAAEWCASTEPTDIAEGLRRVLVDESRREALRSAGLARAAAAPTWGDSATVLLDAYRKAAG